MADTGEAKRELALGAVSGSGQVSLSPGDADLVERLYRDYASPLSRYISSRFGAGPPEPDEVTQAAFAKFAGSPRIAELQNPRSFLFTIACNIVLDHRRRTAHRHTVHRDLTQQGVESTQCDLTPERVLLAKERFAIFESALKAMPPMRRRIFLLARVNGHTPAALARQFGISESAVHKHVSRALADCVKAYSRADRRGGGR